MVRKAAYTIAFIIECAVGTLAGYEFHQWIGDKIP